MPEAFRRVVKGGHAARVAARLLLYATGGLLLLFSCSRYVRYNPTPSVPRGWYLLHDLPETLPRGALVTACLDGAAARLALQRGYVPSGTLDCDAAIAPVLKRVQAIPGDTVRLTPDGTFVEGKFVAPSPPDNDSKGRRVTPYYGTYVLGEDQYWLGSDHQRGYDSRYFGPVSHGVVKSVARPLWLYD